jgi:hypothetical protein
VRKKLLILAVVLILVIAIPLVIAAVTNSQTISVSGTARYPNLPPTPDPTATPTATTTPVSTSFSLFFANGTSYPSTISNADWFYVLVVDPETGHSQQPMPNEITVQNNGNVPINVTATTTIVNLPSDMSLALFAGDGGMHSPLTVGVGQSSTLYIVIELKPTAYNYTPQQSFSYSFGISVTATQA